MATADRKTRKAAARHAREVQDSVTGAGLSKRTNAYKNAAAEVEATRYVSPRAGRTRRVTSRPAHYTGAAIAAAEEYMRSVRPGFAPNPPFRGMSF